jgi:WD40 repeat protein
MPLPNLPLDLWHEVLVLVDIDEALAICKADPRFLGAYIESKQGIRFRNAINSFMRSDSEYLPVGHLSSFVCSVSRNSSLDFSALLSWLSRIFRPILSSSIVENVLLFKDLSSTIALKDRGFVSVSSSVEDWTVEMKADDVSFSSVSWILVYRASLSGYGAADFHQACDGMGKCVVVVKAENGRIVAAYNEDGFTSEWNTTSNLKGFIISIAEDGSYGEIFHRNDHKVGVTNYMGNGPLFGKAGWDLGISSECHQNEFSSSRLGVSYENESGLNDTILFGQARFRVLDYEVFKIII